MNNKDNKDINLTIACVLLDRMPFFESWYRRSEIQTFMSYSRWAKTFVFSDRERKNSYLKFKVFDIKLIIKK